MNTPYEELEAYEPVELTQVNAYLKQGFVPRGDLFYDRHKKCYCQVVIKYPKPWLEILKTLTRKEAMCLGFLLQDFSIKSIAKKLNCSPSAVDKLIPKISNKFCVRSTALLRVKARELCFQSILDPDTGLRSFT